MKSEGLRENSSMELEGQLSKRQGIILVVIGLVVGIAADQLWPGWGRPVLITTLVFTAAATMWPQFRGKWWFWTTLLPMAVLQIGVLWHFGAVRTAVEEVNPIILFMLGLADFVCVAAVVVVVASAVTEHREERS